ncbi:MAG: barstar family protein [Lachnospiraceae bacterium]|nr:barstar family protein [Lachnospiraceae bacterium]
MITIDLKNLDSADEFYKRLGEQIELPDYFGYNLDALHDVLDEKNALEIRFTGCDDAAVIMPRFMRGLKRMCAALSDAKIEFE